MNCELCGRTISRYHSVIIDGVNMKVCDDCAKYGKEIKKKIPYTPSPPTIHKNVRPPIIRSRPVSHPITRRKPVNVDDPEEPVEEYGKLMKSKREEMGLSQEELASKLQEKKNLVAKIEREEIKPDKHTAKKIEKVMGIRILEKIE